MFEPGDVVICIKDDHVHPLLVLGAEYTVRSVEVCNAREWLVGSCMGCGHRGIGHELVYIQPGPRDPTIDGWCPTRFRKKLPPVAVTRKAEELEPA